MKKAICASLLVLAFTASARDAPQVQPVQVDASRPDWENPAIFERGKLPARAALPAG